MSISGLKVNEKNGNKSKNSVWRMAIRLLERHLTREKRATKN